MSAILLKYAQFLDGCQWPLDFLEYASDGNKRLFCGLDGLWRGDGHSSTIGSDVIPFDEKHCLVVATSIECRYTSVVAKSYSFNCEGQKIITPIKRHLS